MAKLCLCLTGATIEEDLAVVERYRSMVDLVELRVDCLNPQERFSIRVFPEKARIPTILTVRRTVDGGNFEDGEGVRLVILAKGLSYANDDPLKNFAYIDLESDFRVPALEEAARTFGTHIIRSFHSMDGVPENIGTIWREIAREPYEIPKLALRPRGVGELARLLKQVSALEHRERIIVGMGDYGFCTRLLVERTGSSIVYSYGAGAGLSPGAPGQIDPEEYRDVYRWRELGGGYALYGIIGGSSVTGSLSPSLHNSGFAATGMSALYVPFPVDDLASFFDLAEHLDVRGFSVTVPYKEKILPYLAHVSPAVEAVGACNTAVRSEEGWVGYNTDHSGFEQAVLRFMGKNTLHGIRACIIGAGGAARAIAYALHKLGASACIINRTMAKAKALAEPYGFEWSGYNERAVDLLDRYNELIVQTTSVGMNGGSPGDPLELYEFTGNEAVFETIYSPLETPLLARAAAASCRVTNGLCMLREQAAEQFELFTGRPYPNQTR